MGIKKFNEFPLASGTNLTPDDILLLMDDPNGSAATKKVSLATLASFMGVNGGGGGGGNANTGDITFSGSTISTANQDQSLTITTNGSGDIYIGADRNMIFDMNAFSAKGILLQDSQEDGYDNENIPSLLKVGSIYHETGRMVIQSDGRIFDASGVQVDVNGEPTNIPMYGGLILTNGENATLNIPGPSLSGPGDNPIEINNNEHVWEFTNNGNTNLPEGKTLNFGQNSDTLGPPVAGGATDRIRLWDFEGSGSNFNYAIGAEANHVWFAMDVNNGDGGFKFYSRDNEILKISDDSKIIFPNSTTVAQGTFNNGTGGNGGISLNCVVGYELNWQGGRLRSTADNGVSSAPIYVDSPMCISPVVIDSGYTSTFVADAAYGDMFDLTLTGNILLDNPINPINGKTLRWRITQDGTGNRVVTLGSKFNIPSSASNTLPWSTAPNKMDVLAATYHAGRDKWDIVAFVPGY